MMSTLSKTNIAPKNGLFPLGISFSRGLISDATVDGRNPAPGDKYPTIRSLSHLFRRF